MAHSLPGMMRNNMGNFMSQYSSQTIFVPADPQDPSEDEDLPTGAGQLTIHAVGNKYHTPEEQMRWRLNHRG